MGDFRFDELSTELRSDALLPPMQLQRRKYLSTALLVIDELGFEPMNRQEAGRSSGWSPTVTAVARS